jgi:hypothetical protein
MASPVNNGPPLRMEDYPSPIHHAMAVLGPDHPITQILPQLTALYVHPSLVAASHAAAAGARSVASRPPDPLGQYPRPVDNGPPVEPWDGPPNPPLPKPVGLMSGVNSGEEGKQPTWSKMSHHKAALRGTVGQNPGNPKPDASRTSLAVHKAAMKKRGAIEDEGDDDASPKLGLR